MEKVEYKVIQLAGNHKAQADMLDHLNEVEGWELVAVVRSGATTTRYPHGRLVAYLKRPLDLSK